MAMLNMLTNVAALLFVTCHPPSLNVYVFFLLTLV